MASAWLIYPAPNIQLRDWVSTCPSAAHQASHADEPHEWARGVFWGGGGGWGGQGGSGMEKLGWLSITCQQCPWSGPCQQQLRQSAGPQHASRSLPWQCTPPAQPGSRVYRDRWSPEPALSAPACHSAAPGSTGSRPADFRQLHLPLAATRWGPLLRRLMRWGGHHVPPDDSAAAQR